MDLVKVKVQELVANAKTLAQNGKLAESMQLFKEAYKLMPTEKLSKRIDKLQEFIDNMDESDDSDEDTNMIDIGNDFFLHKNIASKLYSYQKEGVLWFWKLFLKKQGGILGDDMGLGKTIQVIAFLAGMFDEERIKHVLIVAPLAVICNWQKEFEKWAGGIRMKEFHSGSKKQRLKNMYKIQNSEGILITTYGMVVSNTESFNVDENGELFRWDYIILDEGHKIKNATKTSKCIRNVRAKYHYLLTGTPIQNSLSEMWSLFDFTQQGQLLGTKKTFNTEFEKPIVRAREKNCTAYEQEIGNKMADSLRLLIKPYFLRRTKAQVFDKKNDSINNNNDEVDGETNDRKNRNNIETKAPKLTTKKNDLIIWVYLSDLQLKLYEGFVKSERVKQTLMTTRSPLAELNLLKKISDHPRLQSTLSKLLTSSEEHETRLACGIELEEQDSEQSCESLQPEIVEEAHAPPVQKLIEDSGKMIFLVGLMKNLKKENHRTIIFSQSRKMLDIIQKVLLSMEFNILRIDGTISNPQEREKIVEKFQTDRSYNVMLMTTQVGSVGLTLTGADRLVIFDPSWNPGTDAQAVDRVYRLGQTRDVIIYRLMTCGSIEEKIYRKQIFKNAVMKQATGSSNNPYRYFSNQELRELFVLDDPKVSTTQQQLEEMHPHINHEEVFEDHLTFLHELGCIYGISHHDQLFTQEAVNESTSQEFDDKIDAQVSLAKQRVAQETNPVEIKTPPKRNSKSSGSSTSSEASSPIKNVASPLSRDVAQPIELDASEDSMHDTSAYNEEGDCRNSVIDVTDDLVAAVKNIDLTKHDESESNETANVSDVCEIKSPSTNIDLTKHDESENNETANVSDDACEVKNSSKNEVKSPSTNTEVKSHPTNTKVKSPSTNTDVKSPSTNTDVKSPSTNTDVKSPSMNEVKSPSTNTDIKERRKTYLFNNSCFDNEASEDESHSVQNSSNCSAAEQSLHSLDYSSNGEQSVHSDDISENKIAAAALHCDNNSNGKLDVLKIHKEEANNESYCEVSDMGCSPIRITSYTVRNLGSNYRTPPVSPLFELDNRRPLSLRKQKRNDSSHGINSSTPTLNRKFEFKTPTKHVEKAKAEVNSTKDLAKVRDLDVSTSQQSLSQNKKNNDNVIVNSESLGNSPSFSFHQPKIDRTEKLVESSLSDESVNESNEKVIHSDVNDFIVSDSREESVVNDSADISDVEEYVDNDVVNDSTNVSNVEDRDIENDSANVSNMEEREDVNDNVSNIEEREVVNVSNNGSLQDDIDLKNRQGNSKVTQNKYIVKKPQDIVDHFIGVDNVEESSFETEESMFEIHDAACSPINFTRINNDSDNSRIEKSKQCVNDNNGNTHVVDTIKSKESNVPSREVSSPLPGGMCCGDGSINSSVEIDESCLEEGNLTPDHPMDDEKHIVKQKISNEDSLNKCPNTSALSNGENTEHSHPLTVTIPVNSEILTATLPVHSEMLTATIPIYNNIDTTVKEGIKSKVKKEEKRESDPYVLKRCTMMKQEEDYTSDESEDKNNFDFQRMSCNIEKNSSMNPFASTGNVFSDTLNSPFPSERNVSINKIPDQKPISTNNIWSTNDLKKVFNVSSQELENYMSPHKTFKPIEPLNNDVIVVESQSANGDIDPTKQQNNLDENKQLDVIDTHELPASLVNSSTHTVTASLGNSSTHEITDNNHLNEVQPVINNSQSMLSDDDDTKSLSESFYYDTQESIEDTNKNVEYIHENIADTQENIADTPDNIADTPDNIADTPDNIADTENVKVNDGDIESSSEDDTSTELDKVTMRKYDELESLLKTNMNNKDIDEHLLIHIVKMINELNIC